MKNMFTPVVLSLLVLSCSRPVSGMEELLTGSDSVAVNVFTGSGKMDTVVRVLICREQPVINALAKAISAASAERQPHCGVDGSLHFFKNNQVLMDVYYRLPEGNCRQFSFTYKGEPQASKLSDSASALITRLTAQPEGRP